MAYVPMANEHMSSGALDQIEHQALALESTVRIQQSEITVQRQRTIGMQEESRRMEIGAEESQRAALAGDGHADNGRFSLYSDLALEASGLGPLAKAGKDIYALMTDGDPGKGVTVGGRQLNTFEDMIKGAMRTPGVYNDKPAAADTLADAASAKGAMSITEKANLAGQSLTSQTECNLTTWSMKSTDMPSTEMQQNLVFGQQLASEASLTSVRRARMIQAPSMGPGGNTMAAQVPMRAPIGMMAVEPTISLAAGPKPPSFDPVDEESMVG